MAELNVLQAVNGALGLAMEQDSSVMLLGQDIGKNGGVFRATDGLQDRFGEDRVVDAPLAESGIVGTSVGLAMNGFKPVAEIQFMGFMYATMEQLASQAARMRFRTSGRLTVPMVIRGPYGGGVHTQELHPDSLETLFVHTPGIKVVFPSSPHDAKGLLLAAIEDPDPVIFFEPIKLYRAGKSEVPEGYYRVPLGEAKVLREGEDVTLVTWGASVSLALSVADRVAEQGASVEVIDVRTLVPFDGETVFESVRKTGRVVVLHEAVRTGGFGAEVATQIMEHAFLYLEAPITRVTGYDTPYPAPLIEHEWLPSEARLSDAIFDVLNF
jgi:pyruvate dehydrogenase E1 component beta subunit